MKELVIEKRPEGVKPKAIRERGYIPAVFYGPKEDATPIMVAKSDFIKLYDEVGGSAIVSLTGVGDEKEVLIHSVDWHPVSGDPISVDFYCIERGKKLTVTVPLTFVGEASAEKLGGIVAKALHELEIEVRPRDIPSEISVDLSALTELDSTITVADLNIDSEIDVLRDAEDVVASVTVQKEEAEEEERSVDDVEIEGKGGDENAESGDDSEEKSE